MANFPRYTEEDFINRKVDYDNAMIYNMPYVERTIFQYAIRDKCLKEIISFEADRELTTPHAKSHPKKSLDKSRDILRCFVNNIKYEPICNKPFNDARECLFRSTFKLRMCKGDLDLFEECYNNPEQYAKMVEAATESQLSTKNYFLNIRKRDVGSI